MRLRLQRPFTTFPDDGQCLLFPEVRQQVNAFLEMEAGVARRQWPKLLRRAYPELKEISLEDMLVKLVVRSFIIRFELQLACPARMHHCVEFCSGVGNLTLACCLAVQIIFMESLYQCLCFGFL